MRTLLAWVVALLIFGGWMKVVGNPHVIETCIGLVLAAFGGLWAYGKLGRGRA